MERREAVKKAEMVGVNNITEFLYTVYIVIFNPPPPEEGRESHEKKDDLSWDIILLSLFLTIKHN